MNFVYITIEDKMLFYSGILWPSQSPYSLFLQFCTTAFPFLNCNSVGYIYVILDQPLNIFMMNIIFFKCFYSPDMERAQLNFANKQPPKKKRKSRTAFTNHQIFELEKRFLYQKYLSPADRDEIAAQLGLSNAQVTHLLSSSTRDSCRHLEE